MTTTQTFPDLYSPLWWEEVHELCEEINKNLKALNSQFRRCYAYRTDNGDTNDVHQLKDIINETAQILKTFSPVSKWVENSKNLAVSGLSISEKAYLYNFCLILNDCAAVNYKGGSLSQSGWEAESFRNEIGRVATSNKLLSDNARLHVASTASLTIVKMIVLYEMLKGEL